MHANTYTERLRLAPSERSESTGEVAGRLKAAVCQGHPSTKNRPELADFRPVFAKELGCRWVLLDRCGIASGHTFGHRSADVVSSLPRGQSIQ